MNSAPLRAFLLLLALVSFAFPLPAQISFFQPPSYSGGGANIFVADFNDVGKLDLLTSDGTLDLGKGDATFSA